MRIIGGEAKGREIRFPKGSRVRPTTDRVKKSLFDILSPIAGKTFLDLFAGSGNIGLEALSRGASFAAFVEKEARLAEAIRTSLSFMAFQGRSEVVLGDAGKGTRYLVNKGRHFDILFADPPYTEGFLETIPSILREAGAILTQDGIVVIQHSVREPLPVLEPELILSEQRRYGDTMLSFIDKITQGVSPS